MCESSIDTSKQLKNDYFRYTEVIVYTTKFFNTVPNEKPNLIFHVFDLTRAQILYLTGCLTEINEHKFYLIKHQEVYHERKKLLDVVGYIYYIFCLLLGFRLVQQKEK